MNFDKIPTIKKVHEGKMQYGHRLDSIDEMMKHINSPCNCIQFGVAAGHSARYILSLLLNNSNLYLLDSFEGLPEDWGNNINQKKGAFKLTKNKIPKFEDKFVKMIKGWFKDTVPKLAKEGILFKFLHIDCDIYSSTIDALFGIANNLDFPCYILFDEFYNYPEYEYHEYKAFFEFIEEFDFKYEPLFKTGGSQVAFKVWRC